MQYSLFFAHCLSVRLSACQLVTFWLFFVAASAELLPGKGTLSGTTV